MPKVSIIVPVYNAEKALHRCIDSILHQEFSDFELFLMDDGSRDGSPAIIDEYAAADTRIHAVHKENSGVSDTRNMAIDIAQGDYIQFVDADDWITPDSTKTLVRAADENQADMVIADFYRVVWKNLSQKGDIDAAGVISRTEYADYMIQNPADYYYGVIWNKLYRRDILNKYSLRMDENLSYCEDFIFNMEYVLHADRIAVVKSPVYYYVKTEGSLVSQNMNPADVVRMKTNVIQYYDAFYRNVYDDIDYFNRKPEIYGFLLDFSGDDFALPFMPGTKKVGKEAVVAEFNPNMDATVYTENYYENRLLEYYLSSVAKELDLELADANVLLYVQQAHIPVTEKMILDYTGLGLVAVTASIQKLRYKKLIKSVSAAKAHAPKGSADRYKTHYVFIGSERLSERLQQVFTDFDNLRFKNFTEEERKQYRELGKRSVEEIIRFLAKPEADR